MEKILYVSDLDGTLLRPDQKTSAYTNQVINQLVEKGICFSYATARSSVTSTKVTDGMKAEIPIIVYNGCFILDSKNLTILASNVMDQKLAKELVWDLTSQGIHPLVYSYLDGKERYAYEEMKLNKATKSFVDSRQDERQRPVALVEELLLGETFYVTCIGEAEDLEPMYLKYKDKFQCIFHRDIYSGDQWLEIMSKQATKANAVKQLKTLLNCDKVVAFGDDINDITMFQGADACYAVANAAPSLKELATAVITSNEEDGVAHWLEEHC